MAPTSSSPTNATALIYRIYFLYLDPILALGGAYLIYTDPSKFLHSTIPQPLTLTPTTLTPLLALLLTNIAALYVYLALNEALVLRLSSELKVWKAVILGLVISDAGHIYAVYAAAPERLFEILKWTNDEWINNGILILGLLLRIGFLVGFGNRK
ncbi:hypothetical protein B0O99DRAFT_652462 [Bisporella sp. PMI_857]|nr:hypothetical protein B0O99DRAFT_652462 [Bisporella sp. PMI_857]